MAARIRALAATFLALCIAIAVHQPLQGSPDQEQALRELENRWLNAEYDPSALESILADDFVHVLPSGFVTKVEQLSYMRAHPSPQLRAAKRFDDMRVRVYGSTGIVNGIVVATMPDGKVRKTVFTDVFAYRNGKWEAVNAQELPLNDSAGK